MSNDIVIGSYYNTMSSIHKCHPITKTICSLLLIMSIIICKSNLFFLLLLSILFMLINTSKIPIDQLLKFLFNIKYGFMVILIIVLITSNSLLIGISIFFKVFLIIITLEIYLFCTSVDEIVIGMKIIFSPLEHLKISSNKISLSLAFTFHLISVFSLQYIKIFKNQEFSLLSSAMNDNLLISKIKSFKIKTARYFSSTLKKIQELSESFELRKFDLSKKRSCFCDKRVKFCDIILIMFFVNMFIISLF